MIKVALVNILCFLGMEAKFQDEVWFLRDMLFLEMRRQIGELLKQELFSLQLTIELFIFLNKTQEKEIYLHTYVII